MVSYRVCELARQEREIFGQRIGRLVTELQGAQSR
jgi:hypothetical protein